MESPLRRGWSWLTRLFRQTASPPPYRPEPQPLAPFEQALDEGLLIARHGVMLAVKNRLILRALREDDSFDDEATAEMIDEELARAADEQRANAGMIIRARARAGLSGGIADHAHDYHLIDSGTLRRRENLYEALAESLDGSRSDPEFIADLTERARSAAWKDIGANVVARLEKRMVSFADDPDYILDRQDRLRELLEVDLPALEAQAKDDTA
ncbi:hypothetical protein IWX78_001598 [Mycetocola sp. CAN_C7]|uniref:hypothetical protein n=1 Tax=Mycetocola sp. CAN_C7 TaxID=2787724 RepID=UPI0018CA7DE3